MRIKSPKGTNDVLPNESYKWQYAEGVIRQLCRRYGFNEVRTPAFEHTELFLRGVGDTTDIVQKEMYTFLDKGGRSITLKPEGTAGVARMFAEHGLFNEAQPTKMYYLNCPVFRYDKPQAGRYREHHQFGIEAYGAKRASMDAECIAIALDLFKALGVEGLTVRINSIGCPGCRPEYNRKLREYLSANYNGLCEVCRSRFEKNPLRILDCKEERCKRITAGAPIMINSLCGDCTAHFEELKACLEALGIAYEVDPFTVRGLDYYTKTVFEIVVHTDEYTDTVCGGGRYDGLLKEVADIDLPGVGFGLGLERLLIVAEQFRPIPKPNPMDAYVAAMGEQARTFGFQLAMNLRNEGLSAEFDHAGRSLKAQLKYADKLGARYALILGDDELEKGVVKLKDMATGEEEFVKLEALAARLGTKSS